MNSTRPDERVVSEQRLIAATPSEIFDLLADPTRHAEIDGSDMVQGSRIKAPPRLFLGATFGMNMKFFGIPYRISNEVVEFEENRLIAWRHFGHHIWRYELEAAEGGTLVTESFDWATARLPKFYELVKYPEAHVGNMERTLERLEVALS